MDKSARITTYLFLALIHLISLTLEHPTTIQGDLDLPNELKNIKTDINLLFSKLNKLSGSNKVKNNRSELKDHQICLSRPCIESSYQLLKNMDLDVDPCVDFYKFSCGNYIKESIIPDDKKKLTSFSPLEDISKSGLMHNTK